MLGNFHRTIFYKIFRISRLLTQDQTGFVAVTLTEKLGEFLENHLLSQLAQSLLSQYTDHLSTISRS